MATQAADLGSRRTLTGFRVVVPQADGRIVGVEKSFSVRREDHSMHARERSVVVFPFLFLAHFQFRRRGRPGMEQDE